MATKFFNKRIALVVDGASEDDIPKIKDRLLDAYGDVEVTLEKDGEDKLAKVSDIDSAFDTLVIDPIALVDCKRF